ncbi:hypothetical protein ACFQE0_26095 [Methylobacterium komagatae]|uniref:Uncharacterized protein n=1 Tax=Methylobacterium komagatae TaxID=374425 RepID=A0ABW2BR64_9HYPH
MLSTLHTYLASLPADDALIASVLVALVPALVLFAAGFEACRAADRAAAKSWAQ